MSTGPDHLWSRALQPVQRPPQFRANRERGGPHHGRRERFDTSRQNAADIGRGTAADALEYREKPGIIVPTVSRRAEAHLATLASGSMEEAAGPSMSLACG